MGDHHHHSRTHDVRLLGVALALILALMVAEVAAGLLAGSLALLAAAGPLLTDAAGLAGADWGGGALGPGPRPPPLAWPPRWGGPRAPGGVGPLRPDPPPARPGPDYPPGLRPAAGVGPHLHGGLAARNRPAGSRAGAR